MSNIKSITYFVFVIYFIEHHRLVWKYHYESELWFKIMIVFVPLVFSLILYLLPFKHADNYDDNKRKRKDWIIVFAPIIAMLVDIVLIYMV